MPTMAGAFLFGSRHLAQLRPCQPLAPARFEFGLRGLKRGRVAGGVDAGRGGKSAIEGPDPPHVQACPAVHRCGPSATRRCRQCSSAGPYRQEKRRHSGAS
jgi:hypothetical protein